MSGRRCASDRMMRPPSSLEESYSARATAVWIAGGRSVRWRGWGI